MPITSASPFKWRHFPGEVILLVVRWYLRYPPLLRTRSRAFGGAWGRGGLQLHWALGASLCTGTEQALPSPSETYQQTVLSAFKPSRENPRPFGPCSATASSLRANPQDDEFVRATTEQFPLTSRPICSAPTLEFSHAQSPPRGRGKIWVVSRAH
jgi:hypothetical protein